MRRPLLTPGLQAPALRSLGAELHCVPTVALGLSDGLHAPALGLLRPGLQAPLGVGLHVPPLGLRGPGLHSLALHTPPLRLRASVLHSAVLKLGLNAAALGLLALVCFRLERT